MTTLEIEGLRMLQRVIELEGRISGNDRDLQHAQAEQLLMQGFRSPGDAADYADKRYAVGFSTGSANTAKTASQLIGAFIEAALVTKDEERG